MAVQIPSGFVLNKGNRITTSVPFVNGKWKMNNGKWIMENAGKRQILAPPHGIPIRNEQILHFVQDDNDSSLSS